MSSCFAIFEITVYSNNSLSQICITIPLILIVFIEVDVVETN